VRIGPPPDLPSLLLANRIVYIGMPLVPSVTVRRLAAPRQRTLSLCLCQPGAHAARLHAATIRLRASHRSSWWRSCSSSTSKATPRASTCTLTPSATWAAASRRRPSRSSTR
jgi:hypothetical protein